MKLKLHLIVAIGAPLASIAQSPVLRSAVTNPAPAASAAVAERTTALIPWSELGASALCPRLTKASVFRNAPYGVSPAGNASPRLVDFFLSPRKAAELLESACSQFFLRKEIL